MSRARIRVAVSRVAAEERAPVGLVERPAVRGAREVEIERADPERLVVDDAEAPARVDEQVLAAEVAVDETDLDLLRSRGRRRARESVRRRRPEQAGALEDREVRPQRPLVGLRRGARLRDEGAGRRGRPVDAPEQRAGFGDALARRAGLVEAAAFDPLVDEEAPALEQHAGEMRVGERVDALRDAPGPRLRGHAPELRPAPVARLDEEGGALGVPRADRGERGRARDRGSEERADGREVGP